MTEEEEMNDGDIAPSSKVDFLNEEGVDPDDDLEPNDKDEVMSFSFGGSRGFEE